MGVRVFMAEGKEVLIHGNFAKVSKRRPKNWAERDSAWIESYNLKWRTKMGSVECDCTQIEYRFAPYYGFTLYHMPECVIGKHLQKYPGIYNLMEVMYPMLAQSE